MRWLAIICALSACGRLGFDRVVADDDGGAPGDGGGFVGALQAYGKANDVAGGDNFGGLVAMSADGSTLAVSAMEEASATTGIDGNQADMTAGRAGAVYVFVRSGDTWTQQAYVKASNTNAGDQFGRGIALSADGNTLVVSANLEDSAATGINGVQTSNASPNAGAVYVFVRAGTTWAQQAYLKASNSATDDDFGTSVSLSADGNTLAVGAFFEDSAATGVNGSQGNNAAIDAGAVYVFTRAGTTWSQQAYVKASNTQTLDLFGESVALSGDGNTLAVGAPLEDSVATGIDGDQADNSMDEAGAVYVFTRSGVVWTQRAYVKSSHIDLVDASGAFDQFGWDVSLSFDGRTLAVGARLEASSATGIDGDQLNNNAGAAGAAYVFTLASTWTQQAYVKPSNTTSDDLFGESVELASDGNTLAVTGPLEDSSATHLDGNQLDESAMDSGAVYLFSRTGTTWRQSHYIKATNTGAGDTLVAVGLAGDASTIVIGASLEDSASAGIGGDETDESATNSGAIYIYY